MAALADVSADCFVECRPALDEQAALLARPITRERRMADAVRALVIDMVESSGRGNPGRGMGLADAAACLWTRALKFDAADPRWPDRDRFVMSAGDGGALLHALVHLTGHDHAAPDDTPLTFGQHPALETEAGAPAQGFGAAVGMALAERLLAARFGKSLVDHRTWVIACDADLMEGLSHEAAGLAGHLRLEKLTVLYDDNGTALGAETTLATSDDVLKRFSACGWAVQRVDGHDADDLASAMSFAVRSKKPTLLAIRTIVGFGAPTRAGTCGCVNGPLGRREAAGAKHLLGWTEPPFQIPDDLTEAWHRAGARGATGRRAWLKRLARHPQRAEFERVMAGRLPENWHEALAALKTDIAQSRAAAATCEASQTILGGLAQAVPELMAGFAAFAVHKPLRGAGTVAPGSYGGRTILYGHRAHAMAAAGNGLSLHGGVIPCGNLSLDGCDTTRPALRMAGLMRQRVIQILTETDDTPHAQGGEHLAGLRAMPNLFVFRPADAMETAECWELALRRADGPSVIVLGRRENPCLRIDTVENRCARGAYVLAEAETTRRATLIASGAEVALAMAARQVLAREGIAVAVVSLACWALFAQQDTAYQGFVLGGAPRLGVEAACGFGWERWLGDAGHFIGPGGSGGPTEDAIVAAVSRRVG